MNVGAYFTWPGLPPLVIHFDSNDCVAMVKDGVHYWGAPPPDVLAHFAVTNVSALPPAGDMNDYWRIILPAASRLRAQGYGGGD